MAVTVLTDRRAAGLVWRGSLRAASRSRILRPLRVPAVCTGGSHYLCNPGMGVFLSFPSVCVEVRGRGRRSKVDLVEHVC